MKKKTTIEDLNKAAQEKGGWCLSSVYINRREKYLWRCAVYHVWKSSWDSVSNKGWCPYCAGVPPQTIEMLKEFAKLKKGECLSSLYVNAKTKYDWKCDICLYEWQSNWDNVKRNRWCPQCAKRPTVILKNVLEFIESKNGELLSKNYKNASSLLKIKCKVCNTIWEQNFNNIKSKNSWCPNCASGKSQKQLKEIFKKIFINQKIEFNHKGFMWLKNKTFMELDFYIPHLKLAIEYDGHQHFRPIELFGGKKVFIETKQRDFLKNKLIHQNKQDVKHFIRIPYWEELTEQNIRNILKRNGINAPNME